MNERTSSVLSRMKASGKNQGTAGGSGSGGLKNATNLSRLERYQPKVFALKGSENLVKIKMNNSKESFVEKSLLKFIGRSSMFRMLEIKEDLVNDWDYGDRGLLAPANWSLKFNACGGKEQSPINFDPNGPSVQQMTFGGFKFGDGHYKSNDGEWYNDGRTVQFTFKETSTIRVSGGPFGSSVYQILQLNLHWGCSPNGGAEHTLKNHRSQAELQFLYINPHKGDDWTRTFKEQDGVAIISIIFSSTNKTDLRNSTAYMKMINQMIDRIVLAKEKGEKVTDSVNPSAFLSYLKMNYYSYNGSLTRPPCYESVTWMVMNNQLYISEDQFARLQKVKDKNGTNMCNNFRPTQDVNSRTVYATSGENSIVNI